MAGYDVSTKGRYVVESREVAVERLVTTWVGAVKGVKG